MFGQIDELWGSSSRTLANAAAASAAIIAPHDLHSLMALDPIASYHTPYNGWKQLQSALRCIARAMVSMTQVIIHVLARRRRADHSPSLANKCFLCGRIHRIVAAM
jgi:hypothetical protein